MNLIGDAAVGESAVGSGRTVVVGVKLESECRELLTWTLLKVAQPGDLVIALHVLDAFTETPSSLLCLVKELHSVLSVYETFCNLKQVCLKLKVCRGSPVHKIIKREVNSFDEAIVIVGISKSRHRIRSSASVAKYCARRLSKKFRILAVNNGKILFHREATLSAHKFQDKDGNGNCVGFVRYSPSPSFEVLDREKASTKDVKQDSFHRLLLLKYVSGLKKYLKGNVTNEKSLSGSENNDAQVINEPPSSSNNSEGSSFTLVPLRQSVQRHISWANIRQIFLSKRHLRTMSMTEDFCFSPIACSDLEHCKSDLDQCSNVDGEDASFQPVEATAHQSLGSLPEGLLLSLTNKCSCTCRLFTYEELLSATSNFIPENMVGKGGSSHVYRGCLPDGNEVAVKSLKPSGDVLKEFVQEIEIITSLRHKNIISLSGFCFEDPKLLLVYNFLSRGSLEENLHGNKKDSSICGWQERFKVALGVAEAVDYLHHGCDEPVIHRDVKSSNILLSQDFEAQLSDFGLASWASSSSHIICSDIAGTFGYLAPEYFMYGKVSEKIDIYAFGVVLLELLSGRKPINSDNPRGQENLVMWAKPILKEGKISQLLDPCLGSDYNQDQIGRMILAATLCIRRSPKLRPQMALVLKLLQGDEEVNIWARRQVHQMEELDAIDGEPLASNIQSHLNLVFVDLHDDSLSVNSNEQCISVEDYLRGRWSRSSSFT